MKSFVSRKLRIQYPGAIYHVMSRGDHSESIFEDDQDRGRFLRTMEECCEKTSWPKAERFIGEACRAEAVSQEQLRRWRKSHPFKVRLALKLRTQTTVTVEWIADRLQMGTREHAAHLLSEAKNRNSDVAQPTLGI